MKTRDIHLGKNTQSSDFFLQTRRMQITNNLLDIVQNNPLSAFLFWQGRGQNRANSVTGWKLGVTNNDHDCCFPSVCPFLVHMAPGGWALAVGRQTLRKYKKDFCLDLVFFFFSFNSNPIIYPVFWCSVTESISVPRRKNIFYSVSLIK